MNKRFETLDAFRGICAISVVLFHMHFVGAITELDFFKGSAVFVEFFFILSGFVLVHGYGFKKNISFQKFMKARFFRIYPLHLVMLLIFIVLEVGKLFAHKLAGISFNQLPFTNETAVTEILPNLMLIQSWTPLTEELSFNYPSWSISIEFYIYALLFGTIVFFKDKKTYAWFSISFVAFYLIYISSTILTENVLKGLSCFFGGGITYLVYRRFSNIQITFAFASLVEFLLIGLIILVVSTSFKYRDLLAPLSFFITVLIFAFEAGIISKLLKAQLFQSIGKLSYSIYMTHAAILFCIISVTLVAEKITGKNLSLMLNSQRYLDFGGVTINNILILITLTIILYISKITYTKIEIKGLALNKKTEND